MCYTGSYPWQEWPNRVTDGVWKLFPSAFFRPIFNSKSLVNLRLAPNCVTPTSYTRPIHCVDGANLEED